MKKFITMSFNYKMLLRNYQGIEKQYDSFVYIKVNYYQVKIQSP